MPIACRFLIVTAWFWIASGAAPQVPAPQYAGDAACLSCHDTHGYDKTAHGRTDNPRTPAATHGCESCHGAGKAHVDGGDPTAIRNPAAMPLKDGIAQCTACHDAITHSPPDTGCSSCHSIHHAVAAKLLKKR